MTEAFALLICIEATKYVLLSLSFFTLTETICTTIWPNLGEVGGIPQRRGFLHRFGLKTGIDFGLESGMVFEETTRVYERICRFKLKMNQKERSMREFEMAFKKSLCLSSSLI